MCRQSHVMYSSSSSSLDEALAGLVICKNERAAGGDGELKTAVIINK